MFSFLDAYGKIVARPKRQCLVRLSKTPAKAGDFLGARAHTAPRSSSTEESAVDANTWLSSLPAKSRSHRAIGHGTPIAR
jgi:hypothetical protein